MKKKINKAYYGENENVTLVNIFVGGTFPIQQGIFISPVSPGNEALDMPIHKSILHIVSMGYHIIFGGKGFGWFIGLRQAVLPKLTLTKLLSLICIFAFKPMIYRLKWFLYALEEGSNRPMIWKCYASIYTDFKWILAPFW